MYFTETQDNLFLMGRTIRKVMGGGGGREWTQSKKKILQPKIKGKNRAALCDIEKGW